MFDFNFNFQIGIPPHASRWAAASARCFPGPKKHMAATRSCSGPPAAALSTQDAPARVRVVMPICSAREEKEAAAWLPNLTAPGVDLHFVQKSC